MKWKKLILLGDSNTQFGFSKGSGWVSDLADHLQRKCDVINRGFSGYNTDKIKLILPKIFDEFNSESICGVVVMLGSNDSTESSNKIQHVPLTRFETNLQYILDYLINLGIDRQKILLISPAKIDDEKWEETCKSTSQPATHHDHSVVKYAQCVRKIAQEKQLPFLDLNKIMQDFGDDYKDFLFDGLHFSEKGSDLLFENLLRLVNQHIVPNLRFNFPYWRDIKEGASEIDQ
jgi:lysophospholipase L1-like esterase